MLLDFFGGNVWLVLEVYDWRFGIGEEHLLGLPGGTTIYAGPIWLETDYPSWAVLCVMFAGASFAIAAITSAMSRLHRGGCPMTDRKKPGVAFWATVVAVVVLMLYPLSFGPACWICVRLASCSGCRAIGRLYKPLLWIGMETTWGLEPVDWYMSVGVPEDRRPYISYDTGIGYRIG